MVEPDGQAFASLAAQFPSRGSPKKRVQNLYFCVLLPYDEGLSETATGIFMPPQTTPTYWFPVCCSKLLHAVLCITCNAPDPGPRSPVPRSYGKRQFQVFTILFLYVSDGLNPKRTATTEQTCEDVNGIKYISHNFLMHSKPWQYNTWRSFKFTKKI